MIANVDGPNEDVVQPFDACALSLEHQGVGEILVHDPSKFWKLGVTLGRKNYGKYWRLKQN